MGEKMGRDLQSKKLAVICVFAFLPLGAAYAQFKAQVSPPAELESVSALRKSIAVSEQMARRDASSKPKTVPYQQAARELHRCSLLSDGDVAANYKNRLETMAKADCTSAPGPGSNVAGIKQLLSQYEKKNLANRQPASESTGAQNSAAARLAKLDSVHQMKANLKKERELLRDMLFSFDEEVRAPTEKAYAETLAFEKSTRGKEAKIANDLNHKMEAVNQLCEKLHKAAYQKAKENFSSNDPKGNLRKIEASGKNNESLLRAAFQGVLSDPAFEMLMASETFQKSAGLEHIAQGTAMDTCQKNGVAFFRGGRKELGILQVDQDKNLLQPDAISNARKEVQSSIETQKASQNATQRELISKDFLSLSDEEAVKNMTEKLSKHIATHPVAFAAMLQKKPSIELADEMCFLTQRAVSNDIDREHLNTLIMVAGIASLPASFALPGAGAALLSLGMFASLDVGVGMSTLKADQERFNAYTGAISTHKIQFSEGYEGSSKASASIDMTVVSLILASGGAINDLKGMSQGLAKALAESHPNLTPAQANTLAQMLRNEDSDAKIVQFFDRAGKSEVSVAKNELAVSADALRAPSSATATTYQNLERSFVSSGHPQGIPPALLEQMNQAHLIKVKLPDGTVSRVLAREKVEKINKVEQELAKTFGPEKARKIRKELTDNNVLGITGNEALSLQRKQAVNELYGLEHAQGPDSKTGFQSHSVDSLRPGDYSVIAKSEKGENIYGTLVEKSANKWNRATTPETVTQYKMVFESVDGTKTTQILEAGDHVPVSTVASFNRNKVALGVYSKQTGQVIEVEGKAEPLAETLMRKTTYQPGKANVAEDFVNQGDQVSIKNVDGREETVEFIRRRGDFIWVKVQGQAEEVPISDTQIASWSVERRTEHSLDDIQNAGKRTQNVIFRQIPTLQSIQPGTNIFAH